jgi:hypothetical protein
MVDMFLSLEGGKHKAVSCPVTGLNCVIALLMSIIKRARHPDPGRPTMKSGVRPDGRNEGIQSLFYQHVAAIPALAGLCWKLDMLRFAFSPGAQQAVDWLLPGRAQAAMMERNRPH